MEIEQQPSTVHKMDAWPESFQDLRSWCHPDQDELNTPQITMQDEFNFSPEGQANNCEWGYVQSPVELNDQLLNQEILLASPNNAIIDEENNNYTVIDIQGNFTSYNVEENLNKSSLMGKSMEFNSPMVVVMPGSSALKTKGSDVLLSQAVETPKTEEPPLGGGGSFFDIKLNSSQVSNSSAMRLGSGGTIVFKMDDGSVANVSDDFRAAVHPQMQQQQQLQHQAAVMVEQKPPLAQSQRPGKPNRPKLKPLNIPQPQATNNHSTTTSLATPDVLKPLSDTNGFNLLSYITEVEDVRTQPAHEKEGSLEDHDYAESVPDENILIKCEPLSPASSLAGSSLAGSSIGGGRKRRRSSRDDDYFDEDGGGLLDGDSGSEEWLPGAEKRNGARTRRGRKPSTSLDSLDGSDRYRALRDRNNEASRRSRQNRKQRDLDIKKHKTDLEKRHAVLKVKAERMENLVKEMRAALLQSIKNSRLASMNT